MFLFIDKLYCEGIRSYSKVWLPSGQPESIVITRFSLILFAFRSLTRKWMSYFPVLKEIHQAFLLFSLFHNALLLGVFVEHYCKTWDSQLEMHPVRQTHRSWTELNCLIFYSSFTSETKLWIPHIHTWFDPPTKYWTTSECVASSIVTQLANQNVSRLFRMGR